MQIRAFNLDDIHACAALHKISRRESEKGIIFDSDLDRYDLNQFVNSWTDWSNHPETFIRVAEIDGTIVGFVMFGKVKTRPEFDKGVVPKFGGEIYALYVHPDYFHQGIGTALFKQACSDLAEMKLTSMLLWALKKNKRACAFYDKFGGERVGKKRVDMGEQSWAEESCFAWRDIRKLIL